MIYEDKYCEKIVGAFDLAASGYDAAADIQPQAADALLRPLSGRKNVHEILDIGCGTGILAMKAAQMWPEARLTVLDAAPRMLAEVAKKLPSARLVQEDAASCVFDTSYDLVLSGMVLHWLPQPEKVFLRWKKALAAGGVMAVSFPVAGSLWEWKELCAAHGVSERVWNFPDWHMFLGSMGREQLAAQAGTDFMYRKKFVMKYSSPYAFLRTLRATGAFLPDLAKSAAPAENEKENKAEKNPGYGARYGAGFGAASEESNSLLCGQDRRWNMALKSLIRKKQGGFNATFDIGFVYEGADF